MECYKCHSEMTRKGLDGVLVDACPVCEGVWLDGGELEMLEHHEHKTVKELRIEARKEIDSEKKRLVSASRMCPRCQSEALHEKIVAGVELDVCSSCGGMYFDWGELAKVLQTKESKGFMALLDKVRNKLNS